MLRRIVATQPAYGDALPGAMMPVRCQHDRCDHRQRQGQPGQIGEGASRAVFVQTTPCTASRSAGRDVRLDIDNKRCRSRPANLKPELEPMTRSAGFGPAGPKLLRQVGRM